MTTKKKTARKPPVKKLDDGRIRFNLNETGARMIANMIAEFIEAMPARRSEANMGKYFLALVLREVKKKFDTALVEYKDIYQVTLKPHEGAALCHAYLSGEIDPPSDNYSLLIAQRALTPLHQYYC